MTLSKKILSFITLTGYITLSVFSFIHIAQMAEMDMPMENCPFAENGHALCPMTPIEHIKAWQKISTALAKIFQTLNISTAVFIIFLLASSLLSITRFLLYLKRECVRRYSLYQNIFSEGILNSKAP